MGRIYGGIEESILQELVRSTIQETTSLLDEDLAKMRNQVEDIELRLKTNTDRVQKEIADLNARVEKLNSRVEKRPDALDEKIQGLQQSLKQKADLLEVTDRLGALDSRLDRKVEATEIDDFETRMSAQLKRKADLDDLNEKFRTCCLRIEKVDTEELLDRVGIAEQMLEEKANKSFVVAEVTSLAQALEQKADAGELVDHYEDVKQQLGIKAEVTTVDERLSVLHQHLAKKLEGTEDRIERLEYHGDRQLDDRMDYESIQEIQERIDALERKMQRKADTAAIDASLDDLDQRLQMKADNVVMQERMEGFDHRVQLKADSTGVLARLTNIEQQLSQKADEIRSIKQDVNAKVDAAFVHNSVTANQVHIMQQVETLNVTQNKQFNVMSASNNPGLGNNGHGTNSPSTLPNHAALTDQKPKLALPNSPSDLQAPAARPAKTTRTIITQNRNEQSKATGQQLQPQQPQLLRRPRAKSPLREQEQPSMSRGNDGGRAASRSHSRSQSRSRDPGPEGLRSYRNPMLGRGAVQDCEYTGLPMPVRGPDGWLAPGLATGFYEASADERSDSVSGRRRTSRERERQRSPSERRRTRSVSESPASPPARNPRSRSVTPNPEYDVGHRGLSRTPGLNQKSPRVWACKRLF